MGVYGAGGRIKRKLEYKEAQEDVKGFSTTQWRSISVRRRRHV